MEIGIKWMELKEHTILIVEITIDACNKCMRANIYL